VITRLHVLILNHVRERHCVVCSERCAPKLAKEILKKKSEEELDAPSVGKAPRKATRLEAVRERATPSLSGGS
jgi:hypothetical protein